MSEIPEAQFNSQDSIAPKENAETSKDQPEMHAESSQLSEHIEESGLKPKKKKLKRRLRRLGVMFLAYTIPYIYWLYMKFVWTTSKVRTDVPMLLKYSKEIPPYKLICALWHQDVFCVPWIYQTLRPHTIASVGDAGEVMEKLLHLFGYTVFRGGSSKGKKRHKKILDEFLQHLLTYPEPMVVGITVDGSSGPKYRMKHGAVVMSKAAGAPIFLIRIWCKRRFLLPTWDQTMIPLPFNNIIIQMDGPYAPPLEDTPEALEKFCNDMENHLLKLTYRLFLSIDKTIKPELMKDFPRDWNPEDQA